MAGNFRSFLFFCKFWIDLCFHKYDFHDALAKLSRAPEHVDSLFIVFGDYNEFYSFSL